MEEVTHEQCGKCECWRLPSEFLNDAGRRLKTCEKCRAFGRKAKQKQKCPHGRQKSQCKECGGVNICPHGKRKAQCKECGGVGICPHGKRKAQCKECGGTSICPHGREKAQCKECGGSSFCEHGKYKSTCKECGGSRICPHGRIKETCKECGGSRICPHGRRKAQCKDCGGSQICPHGRIKSQCRTCDYPIHPQNWCHSCTFIKPDKRQFSYPYCFQCYCVKFPNADIPRKFKLKENHMCDALKEHFPETTMVFDKQVDGGCSRRRPDVRIECLGSRPVVFLRFNPDKCGGQTCFTTVQEKSVEIVHLFYDKEEEDEHKWFMSLTEEQVKKVLYG